MKSIRGKMLARTLMLVLSAVFISFVVSFASLKRMAMLTEDIFEKTEDISISGSSEMLIELTSSQAAENAKNCAQTVNAKIDKMYDTLNIMAGSIEDIYINPDDYEERPYPHPLDSPPGEYCLQWDLPEGMEMEGDMEKETYRLGNLKGLFQRTLEKNENILSIYFTGASGLNIGYDNTPQTKPPHYEGRNAGWYTVTRDSGQPYLSDTYEDSFGRGKMVTLAVPCTAPDGRFFGVCGMDILIKDLDKVILGIDVTEDSYAMMVSSAGVICVSEGSAEEADKVLQCSAEGEKALLETITESRSGIKKVSLEDDKELYCAFHSVDYSDWNVVFVIPKDTILEPSVELNSLLSRTISDAVSDENSMVNSSLIIWGGSLLLLLLLAIVSAIRISRKISSPIIQLNKSVERIGTGDLDYKCEIRTNDEIEQLSKSFEAMTVSLREYIENYTSVTAEKERISAELNIAAQIQSDMLPRIFPPFPEKINEFDIFASMTPAKEVGGDFYDFFLIDDDHLALVVADVSGKGVPAALFMVIAKTLLKDQAYIGDYSPAKILSEVNNKLCAGNEAELFVTVWLAIIEISTGKGKAANAGHEHPALRRRGGAFELVQYRHSMPLATMEGLSFREHDFQLFSGDTVFMYTDGVPEATDSQDNLYGTDRMLEALNRNPNADPQTLLSNVKSSVSEFVGKAPQFDDLTMLGFTYFGSSDNN
ncbi:MAG: SpoIIE family protein phosphatase [Oscillospiraceae bacterium]|nr:SpoIIE family protein phosphatase [Oscillospiraceae bacterium]